MPRQEQRHEATRDIGIPEYSRMTDNAGVAEKRKREVAKERCGDAGKGREGGREGAADWWQRVKRRIHWCPCPRAARSIRSLARSPAASS